MARVLVVTNTPHTPTNSGYAQRVSAVIEALSAAGHQVKAVSIKSLNSIGHINFWGRILVLVRLLHTPSLSLLKWYSPRACDTLATINSRWRPQIVVLESSYLAPYRVLFHCPVIFDLHNIESQLIGNYAKNRRGLVALAARLESRLLSRMEAAIPRHSDGVATVSDADRETLQSLMSSPSTEIPMLSVPNGVNDDAFTVADSLSEALAPTAVFIGHLGWRPNIDGAKWLANQVWPLVHAALPEAKLQLIGRDPHPSVTELANPAARVTVHGNVASVFPFLSEAAVATAPLWTAGGTRLKILEALGTGTPVVATSLGALGLENLAADHVLQICDSPRDFAAALIKYLSAPAKSVDARNAAETYRWSNTLKSLVELVNDAVD